MAEPSHLKIYQNEHGESVIEIDGEEVTYCYNVEFKHRVGECPHVLIERWMAAEVDIDGVTVDRATMCPRCISRIEESNPPIYMEGEGGTNGPPISKETPPITAEGEGVSTVTT